MGQLREKSGKVNITNHWRTQMPRLFIRHVTRWVLIGVIGMYAIGGFPAVAAACEGGGEEEATTVYSGEAKEGTLTGTNRNPYELLAEVVSITNTGGGAILGGTCVAGAHFASLVTCTVIQDHPVGSRVLWRRL
jgi:hypothetical protein